MCFCFPKQNKIFNFVSANKNIIICGNKKFKYVYLRKQKLKVFLLAETKSIILSCLGKQNIFSCLGKQLQIYLTCGYKAKDFLLLEKTTNQIFFAWEINHRNIFISGNKAKDFLYACENKN